MKKILLALKISFLLISSGCNAMDVETKKLPVSYAIEGTNTAVVGIALDKTGMPKETVREVVLFPGPQPLPERPAQKRQGQEQLRYISRSCGALIFVCLT